MRAATGRRPPYRLVRCLLRVRALHLAPPPPEPRKAAPSPSALTSMACYWGTRGGCAKLRWAALLITLAAALALLGASLYRTIPA